MTVFFETFLLYSKGILPWFILGAAISYVVEKHIDIRTIRTYLGKVSFRNLIIAKVLGMLSPLSIMTALPITGELIRLGANPLMLLGFLIAERSYDLQSFFIVSQYFGTKIAVLNALVILVSLVLATWILRKEKVIFINKKTKKDGDFLTNQAKSLIVVVIGIAVGAFLRTVYPATGYIQAIHTQVGAIVVSISAGFLLYFGAVMGNYPVANAFADLGMSHVGVFLFLTISPLLNLVVILLFMSVVRPRHVLRVIGLYTLIAFTLTMLLSSYL